MKWAEHVSNTKDHPNPKKGTHRPSLPGPRRQNGPSALEANGADGADGTCSAKGQGRVGVAMEERGTSNMFVCEFMGTLRESFSDI